MRIEPVEILVQRKDRTERKIIPIGSVAGARFSSRDVAGMRQELDAALARGESGTKTNPAIFHIGRYLLTQGSEFEVQGPLTGGEAEIVAIRDGNEILITAGSDQCDRELDPLFQDKPKADVPPSDRPDRLALQRGARPLGSLQISSQLTVGGRAVPLQDCAASALVDLEYLLAMEDVRRWSCPPFSIAGLCLSWIRWPRPSGPFASRRDQPRRRRRLSGPAARPCAGSNH